MPYILAIFLFALNISNGSFLQRISYYSSLNAGHDFPSSSLNYEFSFFLSMTLIWLATMISLTFLKDRTKIFSASLSIFAIYSASLGGAGMFLSETNIVKESLFMSNLVFLLLLTIITFFISGGKELIKKPKFIKNNFINLIISLSLGMVIFLFSDLSIDYHTGAQISLTGEQTNLPLLISTPLQFLLIFVIGAFGFYKKSKNETNY